MPYVELYVTCFVAGLTVPPAGSNVTVYWFAVHNAYSFTAPPFVAVRFLTVAPSLYFLVPPSVKAQPLNVYPVFDNFKVDALVRFLSVS